MYKYSIAYNWWPVDQWNLRADHNPRGYTTITAPTAADAIVIADIEIRNRPHMPISCYVIVSIGVSDI